MLKIFIVFVLLVGLMPKKSRQIVFLKASMLIYFVMIGFRNQYCYKDTIRYVEKYTALLKVSFWNVGDFETKDVGFHYFSKITQLFTFGNYTLWFILLAVMYVYPLYRLLKKYSYDYQISLLVFIILGFMFFSLTGIRQTLAMSFTMGALYFLLDKKWKWFILCVLIAPLFHKTAAVFLIALPLSLLPFNKKMVILYISGFIILFKMLQPLIELMVLMEDGGRFKTYENADGGLNNTGLIIQSCIYLGSWFMLGEQRGEKINQMLLSIGLFGVLFQSMSGIVAEMFRISMYFSISCVILFANAISVFSQRMKIPIFKFGVVALFGLYLIGISDSFSWDYYFFFEEPPISAYFKLIN